jgi:transposase
VPRDDYLALLNNRLAKTAFVSYDECMGTSPDTLPNDVESLKRIVHSRDAMIAKLLSENALLKRWRFGRSSERMDEALAQMQLGLDDIAGQHRSQPEARKPELDPTDSTDQSKQNSKPPRRAARAFPAHLVRETVFHHPEHCHCPECGSKLRELGVDISEVLDYVPGYFKVIRHVRPKLSCVLCSRVVQSLAPPRPIERGMASAGLLAQVIVAKYADHTPLYRQEGIYKRAGVELDRATLADWVKESAKLLSPLADSIGRYVRSAAKIHGDDTPVPVLDPGRRKTKTGRIWTYVRDDRPAGSHDPPAVWYRYSPDRKGIHPQTHLKEFHGILQADAYAGFAPLYKTGQVVEAACWAHARRKFYDLQVNKESPVAREALRRIGLLYAIERAIRGQKPEIRRAARQAQATEVLEDLHAWLSATLSQVSKRSELGRAIQYALVRWPALTRYRDDGRIELDNNSAERSIKPIVLGRRNYLFAGSDGGGESAATIYTLIGSARLNGVEPYQYLREVLGRIAEHPIHRIDELLPWHLAEELAVQERKAA